MTKEVVRSWDPVENLQTDEDMAEYLEAALEEGDPALIAAALRDIARAKGLVGPQRCAVTDGEQVSGMFAEGEPGLAEFLKATRSLGLRLHASVVADGA